MSKYIPIESLYAALDFIEKSAVKGEEEKVRCITKAIRDIKFVPADVAEARHGKWVDPEDLTCYKCSVCGEYATQEYGLTEPIFWHYCPNCGAKMDGDTE